MHELEHHALGQIYQAMLQLGQEATSDFRIGGFGVLKLQASGV